MIHEISVKVPLRTVAFNPVAGFGSEEPIAIEHNHGLEIKKMHVKHSLSNL